MAARTAFEAVEKYQQGRAGGGVEMIDVDEVTIRRIPAFPAQRQGGALMSSGHKVWAWPPGSQPGAR